MDCQRDQKTHTTPKLTTFRGVMKFPKLREKSEAQYQQVKDDKRNLVAKEEMGIDPDEVNLDPYAIALEMLVAGKVRNGTFFGWLCSGQ